MKMRGGRAEAALKSVEALEAEQAAERRIWMIREILMVHAPLTSIQPCVGMESQFSLRI